MNTSNAHTSQFLDLSDKLGEAESLIFAISMSASAIGDPAQTEAVQRLAEIARQHVSDALAMAEHIRFNIGEISHDEN